MSIDQRGADRRSLAQTEIARGGFRQFHDVGGYHHLVGIRI